MVYQRTFYGSTTNLLFQERRNIAPGVFDMSSHRCCGHAALVPVAGVSNLLMIPGAGTTAPVEPQLIHGGKEIAPSPVDGCSQTGAS